MSKRVNYQKLVTSEERKETQEDHNHLSNLYENRWSQIKNFPYQSFEYIKQWQFEKLKELVSYAFYHVPLYKKKYSKVGFEPGDLKSWNDFHMLPILYKEELIQGFPHDIVSNEHNYQMSTRSSGSSGKFVTLAVDSEAVYLDTIYGVRQFFFQTNGNYFENDIALFIYTCPWWFSSVNGKYPCKFISTTLPLYEAIDSLRKIRPKILSIYPTYLRKLFSRGIPLKDFGVEFIIVHSEHSSATERKELSKYFNAPVMDEFSSEELTRIALECPHRNYHLEEDACYCEIVDPNTKKFLMMVTRAY